MFVIETPSWLEILRIQRRERAYYWSRCAAGLLRKHGLIGVDGQRPPSGKTFAIVTRRHPAGPGDGGGFFEGPLAPGVASALGLRTVDRTSRRLTVFDEHDRPLTALGYSSCTVRRIPLNRADEKLRPPMVTAHVSRDRRWNNPLVRWQEIGGGGPWRVVATARSEESTDRVPVVVSDSRRLVAGLPLLDLFAHAHAFPPLREGYYQMIECCEPLAAEEWLCAEVERHARACFVPVVRAARWPKGYGSALTVRHDYDRPIPRDAVEELLRFYEERRLRSSWGFPIKNLDRDLIRTLELRGHEVLLHATAATRRRFRSELVKLGRVGGFRPSGYTAHGGMGSAGYLGQVQFAWAGLEGLNYGEMLNRDNGLPHLANVVRRGLPAVSSLVLPATHLTFDRGMTEDAHELKALAEKVPQILQNGRHAVVMNHPDLHRRQLLELIRGLDLSQTWRATTREVADWWMAFKGKSRVNVRERGIEISFAAKLPCESEITVTDERAGERTVTCPQGASTVRLS